MVCTDPHTEIQYNNDAIGREYVYNNVNKYTKWFIGAFYEWGYSNLNPLLLYFW